MSECKCSMRIQVLGDGCRYCQPQTYIDKLSEIIDDERSEHETELAEVKVELALALKVPSIAAMHTWLDSECAKQNKQLGDELAALKEIPEQIELAGYRAGDGSLMSAESGAMFTAKHMDSYEPLITLAHHNAIVSSIKAETAVPEKYKMQPYQTVDKGSTNYKAGWNAGINAMLAAAPTQPQNTEQDP